jgi:4-hydroxy-tetrahydrodipicolinate synthase
MAIQTVHGRVPVISGVSELSTAEACRYAQKMEEIGADGLMVLPAMAYKAEADEAIHHFRRVGQSTGLPIILYNNPIAYHVDLKPEHFEELSDQANFVAIKESSGDVRRFTDIINRLGDRYTMFAGVDDLALECALLGATGWIAGIGLALPAENQYLWELMMAGEWEKAREIYRWYTPLLHLDVGLKFVQNIKLAIQECGLGTEWVREPRLALTGAERDRVLAVIREGIRNRPTIPARVAATS